MRTSDSLSSNLVAVLRELCGANDTELVSVARSVAHKAALEIDRLTARVAELESARDDLYSSGLAAAGRADDAERERDRLRAALERITGTTASGMDKFHDGDGLRRIAREALAGQQSETEGKHD